MNHCIQLPLWSILLFLFIFWVTLQRISGISWLELVNYFLQFLFIRLTRCTETSRDGIWQWYAIQYWIIPFTGWHNGFRLIGKSSPKFWAITKQKKVDQ